MAIALIGAMLRKNSSERKWKAIADKMVKKHLILEAKANDLDYGYPTLNASIELRYMDYGYPTLNASVL